VAEYDIAFAIKLAEVATDLISREPENTEARRTVIYLSRLSMEISMKSFLEHAGVPLNRIRSHSHNLRELLSEIDKCEIQIDVTDDLKSWCPASRVRSVTIPFIGHTVTLGIVIGAEEHGASQYPNQIRYGAQVQDIPPEALGPSASALASWVAQHSGSARLKQ
jgi:hypothetical protein